jgi:excisionase family DNA binding protein
VKNGPAFSRDDLLRPEDVAAVLGVKRSTVLDWLRCGRLPGAKFGRTWLVSRPALEAHLAELFERDPYG